jgi:hypothetical protein
MDKRGVLTAEIAKSLKFERYDVFYDHGNPRNPNVGKIVSSINEAPAQGEELSQLDIAIIEKTTKRAVALIEIEEKTDTPKTFLGDIFGILMGRSISFKDKSDKDKSNDWNIGNWTTLIIFGRGKSHDKRNERIREMALKAKSSLETENSKIGNIFIGTFLDKESLNDKLGKQIEIAMQRNK